MLLTSVNMSSSSSPAVVLIESACKGYFSPLLSSLYRIYVGFSIFGSFSRFFFWLFLFIQWNYCFILLDRTSCASYGHLCFSLCTKSIPTVSLRLKQLFLKTCWTIWAALKEVLGLAWIRSINNSLLLLYLLLQLRSKEPRTAGTI